MRSKNPQIQKILEKNYRALKQKREIDLCWIPGHRRVPGNRKD